MPASAPAFRRAVTQARVTAHAVRHLGLHTVGLIVANSARRQVHHARSARAGRDGAVPVTPGRLLRAEAWNPSPGTVLFHFERARLEVAFLAADVVRLTWGPGPLPVPYALADDPGWPVPDVQAHPIDALKADGAWVLRSETLEITVAPDGSLRAARPGGPTLRRESPPARRGGAWEQSWVLRPGERLRGLGEQSRGLDLRGSTLRLWNRDPGGSWGPGDGPLYLNIPVMIGSHAEGSLLTFWENSTDATVFLRGGAVQADAAGTAGPAHERADDNPDHRADLRGDHRTDHRPHGEEDEEEGQEQDQGQGQGEHEEEDHEKDTGRETATVRFAGGVVRTYLVAGDSLHDSPHDSLPLSPHDPPHGSPHDPHHGSPRDLPGDLPHLLDRFTALTGRPALPPRWALGYHQSRWGYRCEGDVRSVVDGYRRLGLPLSAVHLDIDYMRGFRVFTVDPDRFPDLGRLAEEVGTSGTRLVTIVDPGVKVDPDYDLYRQGRDGHRFCTDPWGRLTEGVVWPGRSVYPDFTNPATREWWSEQYAALTGRGVAGIWHDMNEPTSIALLGDPTLPSSTRHDFDGRGGDHVEGHNLYGLLMNRAGFEGLRRARPDRRPFVVSRSGWAGMARWAWNWTGDAASTWSAMRQQIATVVGLGLSGVPYSGSDIGGFSGVPDDELYLRWLQMSVFMPYCRTHSVLGVPAREPWCFAGPTGALVEAWIRFRYRLLPYLYTLAHQATETGAPLVRPLSWPAAAPAALATGSGPVAPAEADADDAFLLGDALLVAPVCTAGSRQRTVPLPPGSWSSLWGDEVVDRGAGLLGGPTRRRSPALCAAPLERPVVLVRAGAVVPLDDGWADAAGPCGLETDVEGRAGGGDTSPRLRAGDGEAPRPVLAADHAPLALAYHCFPDAGGYAFGTCVDDAGDGDGPRRVDTVTVSDARAGETATVRRERSGSWAEPASVRVVLHGLHPARATADGVEVAVSGGVVTCPAFTELTLHDLVPSAPPAPPAPPAPRSPGARA